MSLVGSLEDLGLGDILQIVSLSRKSGLLLLRSEGGDGRIFFRDGLVQAATVKGEADDLRSLLLAGGFADAGGLESAVESARAQGRSAEDAVALCSGLSQERLEALRREHVERAVLRMFRWRVGEFSFEVRDDMDTRDLPLALRQGINAQYLTMEATRLGDEGGAEGGDDFVLSGEQPPLAASPKSAAAPEPTAPMKPAHPPAATGPSAKPARGSGASAHDAMALATAAHAAPAPEPLQPEPPDWPDAEEDEEEAELPALRVGPPPAPRAPQPPREAAAPQPAPQPQREAASAPASQPRAAAPAAVPQPPREATPQPVPQPSREGMRPSAQPPPTPSAARPEPAPQLAPEAPSEVTRPAEAPPSEVTRPAEAPPSEVARPAEAPPSEVTRPAEAPPSEVTRPPASPSAAPPSRGATPAAGALPLIVIDPELPALEWVKSHLNGMFARIHIFQHTEGGIARIRQYLSRAQVPVVLVSARAPADTLTGAADVNELLSRLRAQAPRMPIVAMVEVDAAVPPGVDAADALVTRPPGTLLVDDKRRALAQRAGADLQAALLPWAHPGEVALPTPPPERRVRRRSSAADAGLRSLKQMSERLRDRATRGEVLNLVLDFAAAQFRRVAMFMVREEDAVGIAQRGLPAAGGPSDEAFLALRIPLGDSAWLRAVLETGESLRAGPSNEGDHRLAAQLGSRTPIEAFVAPIESGGRVAALLYADNLPESNPIGDTTVLAIVLHEAGLALDRAVLERALARAADA